MSSRITQNNWRTQRKEKHDYLIINNDMGSNNEFYLVDDYVIKPSQLVGNRNVWNSFRDMMYRYLGVKEHIVIYPALILKLNDLKVSNNNIRPVDNFKSRYVIQYGNKQQSVDLNIIGFCDITNLLSHIADEEERLILMLAMELFINNGGIVRIGNDDYVHHNNSELQKAIYNRTPHLNNNVNK